MPAIFETLESFQRELYEMGEMTAEYWSKQVHPVPRSIVVDRDKHLVEQATGKTIIHIGCTGPLDAKLLAVSKKCYGIDSEALTRPDFIQCDLDNIHDHTFPKFYDVDLIICGEIVEHLSNPGYFLQDLRSTYPRCQIIVTAPNAFHLSGQEWLVKRGRENVNQGHVCYYSYTTLKELLRRAGYTVTQNYWYKGRPYVSEGLILHAEVLQGPNE